MTKQLEHAFAEASKLPESEQELLASRLLAELAPEDELPRASNTTIERRLEAVELAVAVLQRRLENPPPDPNWLNRVIGSMKDNPAFLEALKYGREYRYSDRPSEDPEP